MPANCPAVVSASSLRRCLRSTWRSCTAAWC